MTPSRAANRSPIKIGLITPQAGGFKSIGDDITNGFQLFLDLHDQRLGGHPVDLLTADEGDTAKTGKAAVEACSSRACWRSPAWSTRR